MSETPWVLRSTKRKSPVTITRPRKRQRVKDDVNRHTKKRQSTLTQMAFVHAIPMSDEDEDDLQEIVLPPPPTASPLSRSIENRSANSTLTQIDWLKRTTPPRTASDGANPSISGHESRKSARIERTGGSYEGFRRNKQQRDRRERSISMPDSADETDAEDASAADCWTNQRASAKISRDAVTMTKRQSSFRHGRSSSKNAHIISTNSGLADIEGGLMRSPLKAQVSCGADKRTKEKSHESPRVSSQPRTPRRASILEIPSSHTPPSKKCTAQKPLSNVWQSIEPRSPLKERSVNRPSPFKNGKPNSKAKSSIPKQSTTRRVCILKDSSPYKTPRPPQIEDSQKDFSSQWNIDPTLKQESQKDQRPISIQDSEDEWILEIPASSEPTERSAIESLAGKTELSRRSEPRELVDQPLDAVEGDPIDSDSDLGSPVANNTQFNRTLLLATSSPVAFQMDNALRPTHESHSTPTSSALHQPQPIVPTTSGGTSLGESGKSHSAVHRLPNPRLIRSLDTNLGKDLVVDVLQPAIPASSGCSQITSSRTRSQRVPLNDVSSPPSSSQRQWLTQKSVHPATIPHPSQISTQDPTQGLPPSSLSNTQIRIHDDDDFDRVTIKDSSSAGNRLSQIPEHLQPSQPQSFDVRIVSESEDEVDDLDLDPVSPSKRNVAKPLHKRAVKTGGKQRAERRRGRHSRGASPSSIFENTPTKHVANLVDIRHSTDKNEDVGSNRYANDLDSLKALLDTITSSPSPSPRNLQYVPTHIPGFDNDTQSNFTQNGHISAAYIHRQRQLGVLPESYIPPMIQIPVGNDDHYDADNNNEAWEQ